MLQYVLAGCSHRRLHHNPCDAVWSVDGVMYWATTDSAAGGSVERALLDGSGRNTLFTESASASYTGLVLLDNCLYISDLNRRFHSQLISVAIKV